MTVANSKVQISQLPAVSSVGDDDLLVVSQGGVASKATGEQVYANRIDSTLSIAGKAADAAAVGTLKNAIASYEKEKDISFLSQEFPGTYVNASDVIVNSSLLSHTDFIEIPIGATKIICCNQTKTGAGVEYKINPNVIFYDSNKTRIYSQISSEPVATYDIPYNAKFVRVNQPNKTVAGVSPLIKFVIPDYSGFIASGVITFGSTAEEKGTFAYLEAGKPYLIEIHTEFASGHVNCYVAGHTGTYVMFYGKGARYFTPAYSGYLRAFNVGGTVTGSLEYSVYAADGAIAKLRETPTVYEVGKGRANKSLTALLLNLKNDDSEKIIYIDGGDYDIFQEYTDLGLLSGEPPQNPSLDYFDYNVWIPANTHIIGRGLVRLIWKPTAQQISTAWSKTISPVNVAGSMSLENVEIHVKNGRYCIHDDPLGKLRYRGARKTYKNVKCFKEANDSGYGFLSVIGFGLDSRMDYNFDSCVFKHTTDGPAFYMHDRITDPDAENSGSTVTVKNSIMVTSGQAVSLGNGASAANGKHHIRIAFESCSIGGSFRIGDEGDKAQGNNPNHFDVTVLRCGDVNVQIASAVNPYPAQIYS